MDKVFSRLQDNLVKGDIDLSTFFTALDEYGNLIERKKSDNNLPDLIKGNISYVLGEGSGYGSTNVPLKFSKTGKELKAIITPLIAELTAKKTGLMLRLTELKAAIGIDPDELSGGDILSNLLTYSYNMRYPQYDENTKTHYETTEQNKMCQTYNDICYEIRDIQRDVQAATIIFENAIDTKKYDLSIAQLLALKAK